MTKEKPLAIVATAASRSLGAFILALLTSPVVLCLCLPGAQEVECFVP